MKQAQLNNGVKTAKQQLCTMMNERFAPPKADAASGGVAPLPFMGSGPSGHTPVPPPYATPRRR
jgi:hypothetical protein